MAIPKPLASLSSGLLARKGGAKPAMRPQALILGGGATPLHDDLGWNDMGAAAPVADDRPAVLLEREALASKIEAPAVARSVSPPTVARLRRETAHADKAAFTLRVDADRHLRLRLASAITDESAQALMTRALDALIAALPVVDTLAAQLPPPVTKGKRR